MKLLSEIPKEELKDKVVLLRAGLNAPIDSDREIIDDFRISSVLPTIKYLAENAKQVIIISHIGRGRDATLAPIATELQKHLPDLHFTKWQERLSCHKLVLLENIRQDPREVTKDKVARNTFAKEIIDWTKADIFVQEAFSVCHRTHTSIVDIPKLVPSYAGLLLESEIKQLSKALNPSYPSLFILGGAKFATKEPLIRKFLKIYDYIFIGGAIANEFFKARSYEVGNSLVNDGKIPHDILYDKKIILPNTVRCADADGHTVYVSPQEVVPNMRIVDAVPPSNLLELGGGIKFILWNGPLGYYEGGFSQGTSALLKMFNSSRSEIITGGGDTLATVGKDYRNAFSHISIGGGAMLTYLQEGDLVGLKALQ